MSSDVVTVGEANLSLAGLQRVSKKESRVSFPKKARTAVDRSRSFLEGRIRDGQTLYGVNTGFGVLSDVRIKDEQLEDLQLNILRSHAAGVGENLSNEVVRVMLLLRAHTLALGNSGCRSQIIDQILALLENDILPCVPEKGSVGASGDLAPLAHLALVLVGEGKASVDGKIVTGKTALKKAGLSPLLLEMKEGLSLINGTQMMTAVGALALLEAEHLCDLADFVGAMSLEAVRGSASPFDRLIHDVRPHSGQVHVAKRMRKILVESGKSQILDSHKDCAKVQDPYSFRCIPQVHGATRDALAYARGVIEKEINSVTDNPLVFPEKEKVLSGGNFHGQYVAMAMDFVAIAVAELASIAEQRMQKLMNPSMSQLPTFLVSDSGLNSGFMMVQVAAASLVSENKGLCHPASVDSIPTNVDKEDHVSMGAWAARKAAMVVANTRKVLAMELVAAAQGIDLLRPMESAPLLEELHQLVRGKVSSLKRDRPFDEDLRTIEKMFVDRNFEKLVRL